jgi:hypothetical protein
MAATTPRLLLASVHDVSPRFETEIDQLIELLQPHVGARLAMLVVPNHWGDAPVIPGSPFAARLRAWAEAGMEMFVHGFFHRDEVRHERSGKRVRARLMTAGEGEFLGLTRTDAIKRIRDGRALVEDVTGKPATGFVAPAWLYGEGAFDALRELQIPIAEDHFRVWSPANGQRLAQGPVITWASRTRLRLASSLAASAVLRRAPIRVLRIGVHPADVRHPALLRSIDSAMNIAAASRHAGRYSDLLLN